MATQEYNYQGNTQYMWETLSLSADVADASFDDKMIGGSLYSVEMKSSADTSVTFSINSPKGTELYNSGSVDATSGNIDRVGGPWIIKKGTTYTVAGLGSGTLEVDVDVWKK